MSGKYFGSGSDGARIDKTLSECRFDVREIRLNICFHGMAGSGRKLLCEEPSEASSLIEVGGRVSTSVRAIRLRSLLVNELAAARNCGTRGEGRENVGEKLAGRERIAG